MPFKKSFNYVAEARKPACFFEKEIELAKPIISVITSKISKIISTKKAKQSTKSKGRF